MFNTLSQQGNANKHYTEIHISPVTMATIKKKMIQAGELVRQLAVFACSCRGPKSGCQHLCDATHNCL